MRGARAARRIAIGAMVVLCQVWQSSARADVISTYTVSDVTGNGGSVSGTFKIDQTTYNYTTKAGFAGGSIQVTGDSDPIFNGVYTFLNYDNGFTNFENSSEVYLGVETLTPPIQNGTEGQVGVDLVTIENGIPVLDAVYNGTLTATTPEPTPAPEPASLAVLGAGLVGLMSIRRRSARAA
jgi:hypothetical protein